MRVSQEVMGTTQENSEANQQKIDAIQGKMLEGTKSTQEEMSEAQQKKIATAIKSIQSELQQSVIKQVEDTLMCVDQQTC
jgi:hypothetical protein